MCWMVHFQARIEVHFQRRSAPHRVSAVVHLQRRSTPHGVLQIIHFPIRNEVHFQNKEWAGLATFFFFRSKKSIFSPMRLTPPLQMDHC